MNIRHLSVLHSASERSALCERKIDNVTNRVEELRIKKKNAEVMKACTTISEALHCSPSNPV